MNILFYKKLETKQISLVTNGKPAKPRIHNTAIVVHPLGCENIDKVEPTAIKWRTIRQATKRFAAMIKLIDTNKIEFE